MDCSDAPTSRHLVLDVVVGHEHRRPDIHGPVQTSDILPALVLIPHILIYAHTTQCS